MKLKQLAMMCAGLLLPSVSHAYQSRILDLPLNKPYLLAQVPDTAVLPPSLAPTAPLATLGGTATDWYGFSLPSLTDLIPAPLFGRCFIEGQFCGGYGMDALHYQIPGSLWGHPLPLLILSAAHYGNSQEMIKQPFSVGGVYGANLGTSIGTLGTKVLWGINLIKQDPLSLPPWVSKIDKALTIEGGCGDRLFGHSPDLSGNLECFAGARVQFPFDLSAHY